MWWRSSEGKLGIKRVGHTGTLDPMVTGVLPICAGQAARITEYLDLDYKTYRCSMILGKMTDTQDIWGQVIEERPADGIGEEDVLRPLNLSEALSTRSRPCTALGPCKRQKAYGICQRGQKKSGKDPQGPYS